MLGASDVPVTAVEGSGGDGGARRSVVLVEGWKDGFQHVSGENQIYDFEYDKIHFFVKTWFGGKGYSAIWWWGWEAEIMAIFTIG